jgi:endonuclease/exonuclease/phosphatase (EEP) superfamily protein YafD
VDSPFIKDVTETIAWTMVVFTGFSTIRSQYWWMRIFDFPRIQVAAVITFILGVYPYFHEVDHWLEFVLLGLLVVALTIQIRYIYPFTVLAKPQALKYEKPDPDNSIRIMISNVRMENREADKFKQIVQEVDPDLLLVNEPDEWWAEQLAVLDKTLPYSVKKPLSNTYGMMLFSRLELRDYEVRFLVAEGIPSIYTKVVLRSGEIIEFNGVHPQPPAFMKNTEDREAELLLVGKMVKKSERANIVAGDLNDVGWSHTTHLFQRISGLLDPRLGRGFFNTYSVFVPLFRYPLDHIFYDPKFRLVKLARLPRFGSDHFPICIELIYQPEKQHNQRPAVANAEDKQEANELIVKGLEGQISVSES